MSHHSTARGRPRIVAAGRVQLGIDGIARKPANTSKSAVKKTLNAPMKPNLDKIDDAVLALLHLTSFIQHKGELPRAWKGHDWGALGRLHKKGFIGDPVGKAKSVLLTEEGE